MHFFFFYFDFCNLTCGSMDKDIRLVQGQATSVLECRCPAESSSNPEKKTSLICSLMLKRSRQVKPNCLSARNCSQIINFIAMLYCTKVYFTPCTTCINTASIGSIILRGCHCCFAGYVMSELRTRSTSIQYEFTGGKSWV